MVKALGDGALPALAKKDLYAQLDAATRPWEDLFDAVGML